MMLTWTPYLISLWSLGLALASMLRRPRSPVHWAFAVGMSLLAAESACGISGFLAATPERLVLWHRVRYLIASFLPVTWLFFSLCFARGNHREFVWRWRVGLGLACLLPILGVVGFERSADYLPNEDHQAAPRLLALGWPATVLNLALLIFSVLVVTNFERTLRAAVGTMRWRIKFLLLGLGLLFTARIYTSSQAMLYAAASNSMEGLNAGALGLACLLVTISFARSDTFSVDLYPPRGVLSNSVTALLAGVYLLIIGVFAKVVVVLGGDETFPLEALLILLSIVIVTVLSLSDRVRLITRRLINRYLRRSLHDYRRVWRSFTERATSRLEEADFCRESVNLISETLQALSVTIWLVDEKQGKFTFSASTSVEQERTRTLVNSGPNVGRLLEMMRQKPEPVNIDDADEEWVVQLRQYSPAHFRQGGGRICLPLLGKGEFLGLLTVGDRVNGVPFSPEDIELLKCMGDQVASVLLNIQLSQKLLQAKEMEAFQNMAAFFVHDLKNTTSSLSLVLQNLPAQFENPEFRQDALRAVSKGVTRINELIQRLSSLRETVKIKRIDANLDQVVANAMESLGRLSGVSVRPAALPLPRVHLDPEQMQKVVTNLLLNASEALGPGGKVAVDTTRRDGWLVLSVQDDGCGMSQEFVQRSLFRPFQTTKKRGLGIGMFHSKMIVEAHQGRIEVETELGKGTTFRVLLPLPDGRK